MGNGTGGSAVMINNINNFNDVIDYIEENLTETLDITAMAKKANMSVYEFRRIFSFAAGIPISEYIRKRRLSAAAFELLEKTGSVTDIALKYGYDSTSSFSRAFKEFQGFSPNEISKNTVKMFTKIGFEFGIHGGADILYKIISEPGFYICGITGYSDIHDTECCEKIWKSFYNTDLSDTCSEKIYAAYENSDNSVKCTIGERCNVDTKKSVYIPRSDWACFSMHGSDDQNVNEFYSNILFHWLNSGSYERNYDIPNIEVFPSNMDNEGFEWDILIPIK